MGLPVEDEVITDPDIPPRDRDGLRVKWLTIIALVALIIGGAVFYSATRFGEVRANTRAIRESCRVRNENISHINFKIDQLNILVDARLRDRPDGSPNPDDVVAAAKALKEPIPLSSCKGL